MSTSTLTLDPRKYRPSPLNTKLVPRPASEKGRREFGSDEDRVPSGEVKANIAIIALLDENYKAINRLNNLTELQRPKGLTYPMTITLTPTNQLVRIDFEHGDAHKYSSGSRNVPAGSGIYYPFAKLYSLKITNDGPAAIFFSTNASASQTEAQYKLNANEAWEDSRNFPTYFSINVVIESGALGNATVRIIGLA
jgi:hypothetical protein